MGTAVAACTIVSVAPRDLIEQCLQTLTLANGEHRAGRCLPVAAHVGAVAQVSVVGGTGAFKKSRARRISSSPHPTCSTSRSTSADQSHDLPSTVE